MTVALYSWVDPTKWTMHESTTAAGLAVAAAQGRNASTVRSYLNRLDLSTPSTHYGRFWCWSAPPQPPPPPPPPVLAPNRMKRTTVKFTVFLKPTIRARFSGERVQPVLIPGAAAAAASAADHAAALRLHLPAPPTAAMEAWNRRRRFHLPMLVGSPLLAADAASLCATIHEEVMSPVPVMPAVGEPFEFHSEDDMKKTLRIRYGEMSLSQVAECKRRHPTLPVFIAEAELAAAAATGKMHSCVEVIFLVQVQGENGAVFEYHRDDFRDDITKTATFVAGCFGRGSRLASSGGGLHVAGAAHVSLYRGAGTGLLFDSMAYHRAAPHAP